MTTTFTNLGGIIFIMGGGSLASKSGWLANYWIYLFEVLVLITVLALVPLNSLPIDNGQARAEIGKIKLNKYVFDCAGWAFCTMLLHNVLNNNISLFVAEEKLGSTAQAALTSTISLIGGDVEWLYCRQDREEVPEFDHCFSLLPLRLVIYFDWPL